MYKGSCPGVSRCPGAFRRTPMKQTRLFVLNFQRPFPRLQIMHREIATLHRLKYKQTVYYLKFHDGVLSLSKAPKDYTKPWKVAVPSSTLRT